MTRALAGLCVRVSRLADRADPKLWVPNVRRRTLLSAAPKDAAAPATRARRRSTRFAFCKTRGTRRSTRARPCPGPRPRSTRARARARPPRARVARAHQHARELLRGEQPVAVDVPFVEILGARARKRRVQRLRLWRRGGEAPRGREGLARGHDRFRVMGFVREVRRPERPVIERGADAVPLKRLAARRGGPRRGAPFAFAPPAPPAETPTKSPPAAHFAAASTTDSNVFPVSAATHASALAKSSARSSRSPARRVLAKTTSAAEAGNLRATNPEPRHSRRHCGNASVFALERFFALSKSTHALEKTSRRRFADARPGGASARAPPPATRATRSDTAPAKAATKSSKDAGASASSRPTLDATDAGGRWSRTPESFFCEVDVAYGMPRVFHVFIRALSGGGVSWERQRAVFFFCRDATRKKSRNALRDPPTETLANDERCSRAREVFGVSEDPTLAPTRRGGRRTCEGEQRAGTRHGAVGVGEREV